MCDYIIVERAKKETWYVEKYDYDGHIFMTENINEAKVFSKREAERIAMKNGMFAESH